MTSHVFKFVVVILCNSIGKVTFIIHLRLCVLEKIKFWVIVKSLLNWLHDIFISTTYLLESQDKFVPKKNMQENINSIFMSNSVKETVNYVLLNALIFFPFLFDFVKPEEITSYVCKLGYIRVVWKNVVLQIFFISCHFMNI